MAIITQADLEKFFPDLANYGLGSIADYISYAEADVIDYFSYIWFPNALAKFSQLNTGTNVNNPKFALPTFDMAKLNINLVKNLITFKCLGDYIFITLMKTTAEGEDSFYARAVYFQDKYEQELARVTNAPIYDFNGDGVFDNLDISKANIGRPVITLVRR